MANTVKLKRPNGIASISTKARYAALVQAVATVVVVVLEGGLSAEALPTAITTLVTVLIALTTKDSVPEGTVVQYPDTEDEFEI